MSWPEGRSSLKVAAEITGSEHPRLESAVVCSRVARQLPLLDLASLAVVSRPINTILRDACLAGELFTAEQARKWSRSQGERRDLQRFLKHLVSFWPMSDKASFAARLLLWAQAGGEFSAWHYRLPQPSDDRLLDAIARGWPVERRLDLYVSVAAVKRRVSPRDLRAFNVPAGEIGRLLGMFAATDKVAERTLLRQLAQQDFAKLLQVAHDTYAGSDDSHYQLVEATMNWPTDMKVNLAVQLHLRHGVSLRNFVLEWDTEHRTAADFADFVVSDLVPRVPPVRRHAFVEHLFKQLWALDVSDDSGRWAPDRLEHIAKLALAGPPPPLLPVPESKSPAPTTRKGKAKARKRTYEFVDSDSD